MNRKFYVTTPIYYVNDVPHIGHAYTTIAADILARRNRTLGNKVFFLTGTDEHGQKVEKAAKERMRSPKEHADLLVGNFRNLWEKLNVSNDAFIRTTDPEHVRTVQGLLQRLWEKGEIEKRAYSGWYCTPDERFWTGKDLVGGKCPDCGRSVDEIEEENYFFLMSKYQERLIAHIEDNPDYILPETRKNEVLGFLSNNTLGDLCISRPKQRLSWGVPIPFDDRFVTYVWFDALVNYFSATRYLVPEAGKAVVGEFWWPASHHLVGKDILTTHAVYWSTMLMALDFPLPGNIFAHGWWTVNGEKMSKSVGNVVDPVKIVDKYGADAFRYFLFREVPFGLDGDFSEEALVSRINTDLANDLGNLLSRFLTMAEKYLGGTIEQPAGYAASSNDFALQCIAAVAGANDKRNWTHLRFNIILDHIWEIIRAANNYIAQKEPWKVAKNDPDALKGIMYDLWNSIRIVALSLYPFIPESAEKIWKQIGMSSLSEETMANESVTGPGKDSFPDILEWEWVPSYKVRVAKADHLFPRIEAKTGEKPIPPKKPAEPSGDNLISISDFARVELKVGKVIEAERIKKSDKLVRLIVDTGERRQIVAGIGKTYPPEDLLGRKIVVVANLQPAKLMGVESNGMLLAATGPDGTPVILTPEKDVEEGSKIK